MTRCAATEVNPVSAERDQYRALEQASSYQHRVYVEVSASAEITVGDKLTVLR